MAFSKCNYFLKSSVFPISHKMLRYSSNETWAIPANLLPLQLLVKMYLDIVPITSQMYFMNILSSESLLSKAPF